MKKFLFLLSFFMLCGISVANDIIKMQATSYAYKATDDYGYWSDWTDWQDCSILVVINAANDRVNIYSNSPQEYDIYNYGEEEYDSEGGTTTTFNCIDSNGLRCDMRIRIQANQQVQLYIDYSDAMWVYNVQPK